MVASVAAPSLWDAMLTTFTAGIAPAQMTQRWPFEAHWRDWLTTVLPEYLYFDAAGNPVFGEHHAEYWDWLWAIEEGVAPGESFVGLWGRGGAKSTSVEMGCAALGARGRRRYVLYVSSTQDQADDHVQNVGTILESPRVAHYYPELGSRKVGKFGNTRGWRRNRLWTDSGFVIDAIGLDTAARGVKLEGQRPDVIVLDDIDKESDSPEVTEKKIRRITHSLLPAGSRDVAVIAIQNLILEGGVFDRLRRDHPQPADWLQPRIVSGPIPAIWNLEYVEDAGRATIVGGTPSWGGQDRETCQRMVDTYGIDAFLAECQHQPRARGEKLYRREWWDGQNRYRTDDAALIASAVGRFMSWDTAESESATSAWTACVTGDLVPYRGGYAVLIREVWRDRVELPALLDAIEAQGRKWGFDAPRRNLHTGCIVEYASSGKAVVQAARSNVTSLRVNAPDWLRRSIRPFVPRVPKDQRAMQAARFCRAGRVLLPEPGPGVPWLVAFEEELFSLPASTYRDQTDALAQLVLSLQGRLREPGQRAPVTGDDGL